MSIPNPNRLREYLNSGLRCIDCLFYNPVWEDVPSGSCCRNAPTGRFPSVNGDDFCSELTPRERPRPKGPKVGGYVR